MGDNIEEWDWCYQLLNCLVFTGRKTGRTTRALQCAIACACGGHRVLFVCHTLCMCRVACEMASKLLCKDPLYDSLYVSPYRLCVGSGSIEFDIRDRSWYSECDKVIFDHVVIEDYLRCSNGDYLSGSHAFVNVMGGYRVITQKTNV